MAEALWLASVVPEITYGLQVTTGQKMVLVKLDIEQNKMARWICGTGRTASTTGVLGEMGWMPISKVVALRKLTLWARIMHMSIDRWPRRMYNELYRLDSGWLKEVRELMEQNGITWEDITHKEWKNRIKKAFKRNWWKLWKENKDSSKKLVYYGKTNYGGREPYIDGTRNSKYFCMGRVGDEMMLTGETKNERCKLCMSMIKETNIIQHILMKCKSVEEERKKRNIVPEENTLNDDDWMVNTLNCPNKQTVNKIGKFLKDWSDKAKSSK
jgi:hypothetical protein